MPAEEIALCRVCEKPCGDHEIPLCFDHVHQFALDETVARPLTREIFDAWVLSKRTCSVCGGHKEQDLPVDCDWCKKCLHDDAKSEARSLDRAESGYGSEMMGELWSMNNGWEE